MITGNNIILEFNLVIAGKISMSLFNLTPTFGLVQGFYE